MGLVNKATGNKPFSNMSRSQVTAIFLQARIEFAELALKTGLEIFRNNVPVDTGALRDAITGRIENDKAVIEVPSIMIHGEDAHRLALVLNIGLSQAGKILLRRKSNQGKNAKQGTPTAHWVDNAIAETKEQLAPLGKRLIIKAANRAMGAMINA